MKKLVSIVVLIYNNYDRLQEVVENIAAQTYERIELIISDDASKNLNKDYIYNIIQPYQNRFTNIIVNINKENKGTVRHINEILPFVQGEIINFIGCGDLYYGNHAIEKVVCYFEENDELICTSKRSIHVREGKDSVLPSAKTVRYLKSNQKKLLNIICTGENEISGAGTYYTRKVFEKYGVFDENFVLLEDCPYYLKLMFEGEKIGILDDITIQYELGGVSSRKNKNKQLLCDFATMNKQIVYANRNKLSRYSKRIVEFKYKKINITSKTDMILLCISYPDVVVNRICNEIFAYLKYKQNMC